MPSLLKSRRPTGMKPRPSDPIVVDPPRLLTQEQIRLAQDLASLFDDCPAVREASATAGLLGVPLPILQPVLDRLTSKGLLTPLLLPGSRQGYRKQGKDTIRDYCLRLSPQDGMTQASDI